MMPLSLRKVESKEDFFFLTQDFAIRYLQSITIAEDVGCIGWSNGSANEADILRALGISDTLVKVRETSSVSELNDLVGYRNTNRLYAIEGPVGAVFYTASEYHGKMVIAALKKYYDQF